MGFSRSMNTLAKAGLVFSVLAVCIIGGGILYLSNSGSDVDVYLLRLGLIIIGGGVVVSLLAWGMLIVISEIGIETQRIRELLEQNVVDSNKR